MTSNNQTHNERKPFASLATKPPMQNTTSTSHGLDGAALSNLTGKNQAPSKWSINIQEIVKRTQKNLERGPSSSKAASGARMSSHEMGDGTDTNPKGTMQYLSKHMKSGFGSSSTKDKSSLLYHDLKKKLSYDSGPQGGAADISAGLRRKDNLLALTGQASSKSMRPTSVNNNNNGATTSSAQIGAKSLYLVDQKASATSGQAQGLHERLIIARLKRRSNEEMVDSYSQEGTTHGAIRRHSLTGQSINDISATTGSIQGMQGGGEMYTDAMIQQHFAAAGMSIEERAINHQRTLMQAGRLNLIGAEAAADEEAQFMHMGGMRDDQQTRNEFRRHNSNMNRPSNINLAIQDQELVYLDDSQAIAEACMTEEQTQRNNNTSMERLGALMERSLEEPTVRTTNNFMVGDHSRGELLKLNHLRPSNSTGGGGTQPIATFTDTQNKRQTTELKSRIIQNQQSNHDVGHRQKIFEEEIIKRIKEIQRYVKSLHLQIKKTQGSHEKLKEEVDSDKDVLVSLQQSFEIQNKKYQNDRLKQVSMAELEGSLKDLEHNFNEKLVLVVQEAADQTLKQVNNDIIPEVRLKMYDSITEETNRLKSDQEYQLQTFKREIGDGTKKDRLKSSELIDTSVLSLRNEILAEQSTQTLSVLAQVDAQIARALKDSRLSSTTDFMPKIELQNLKAEVKDQLKASQSKITLQLREQMMSQGERDAQELEERLAELESRTLEQLNHKLNSHSNQFITPEYLSEKLQSIKQDMAKNGQKEAKKAMDSHKSLFVQTDQLQAEIQKVKREVSKQVKTGLEETKFDTVQMIQGDIVEVSNQQKDARFKVQELSGNLDETRGQLQEAVQRMTNREKEQTSLQMRSSQLQEQQTSFENKLETLNSEIRELKQRELRSPVKAASPLKQEAYDSNRSAPNAFALEELESLRQEIKEISDHCNVNQSLVEETKMEVTVNKGSAEKQIKAVKSQITELSKQVIDVQFEAGQNKQFLEDQLAELTQSTEALQERIFENKEAQLKDVTSLRGDVQKLEQSSDRQFTNIQNGVQILEDWQAKVTEEKQQLTAAATESLGGNMVERTAQSSMDQASNKDQSENIAAIEAQLQSQDQELQGYQNTIQGQQESLDSVNDLIKNLTQAIENVQVQISENQELAEDSALAAQTESGQQIGALQAMLATISERNTKLEDDFTICMSQIKIQTASLEQIEARSVMSPEDGHKILTQSQNELGEYKKAISEQVIALRLDLDEVVKNQSQALDDSEQAAEAIQELKTQVMTLEATVQQSMDNVQRPKSISQLSSSQAQWQESSIKKVAPTKMSGWGELRMTKIEPKEGSMRSSTLEQQMMVCASGPTSNLKSMPPQVDDEESDSVREEQHFDKVAMHEDEEQQLQTPEKTTSMNQSHQSQQKQAAEVNIESQKQQTTLQSMSFDGDEQNEEGENQSDTQKPAENAFSDSNVEHKQIINDSAVGESLDENDYLSVKTGNEGIDKPTEYSASVAEQPTTKRNHDEMGELEIKSPVQFEMMPESDVKVNETNSSMANLLIQDRIAFDDDNNLNDQIISPSEGIQVPNATEFYKLQREIRSNQVLKKTDMLAIMKVQVEQEVESEKVDSPRPLDSVIDDFDQNDHLKEDQPQLLQNFEKSAGSGLLLQQFNNKGGVATTAHLDLDFAGDHKGKQYQPLNEQTQLFRTQKMAGLAQLSQQATHQNALEGLDAHDLELEQNLLEEASGLETSYLESSSSKKQQCIQQQYSNMDNDDLQGSSQMEDDDEIDGLPASSAILGMRLDGGIGSGLNNRHGGFNNRNNANNLNNYHNRKDSDGQGSSIMGLSALGLESHRESQLASENNFNREVNNIDNSTEKLLLQSQVSADSKLNNLEAEMMRDIRSESETSSTRQNNQDEMVLKVVGALVSMEIEEALSIMQELKHPNVVDSSSQ